MLRSGGFLRWAVLVVSAVALLTACARAKARPRLAVVVVIDQMRASYLDDFAHDYHGGFARLLDEGVVFRNAYHDHALTETSPGHATIVTGTYPSRHGVVGNDIWDRRAGRLAGAVLDPEATMVGTERRSGRSPRMMLRTAIGDWLKEQMPAGKVFAVSLKDRSAVFSAGVNPDGAYWYDERTGRFVTSSYYRPSLPAWVAQFNDDARVEAYFGTSWTRLYSDEHYVSTAAGRERPTTYSEFPHVLVGEADSPDRRFYTRFRLTPFADRLTLDFAEALIEAEGLGADDVPDLLLLGLSASDYIGHRYGPWSDEIHDQYARLDAYLGALFAHLDRRLGAGEYTVVLTADHGGMPVPERLAEQGQAAGRLHWEDLLESLAPIVAAARDSGLIPVVPTLRYEFGVIFDFASVPVARERLDALARLVAAELERHPFVVDAYTHERLREAGRGDEPEPEPFGRFARSFFADRSPDVVLRVRENHLITDRRTGTTHVSPHEYDSHVPLIFWGEGIAAAERTQPVRTVDIAPTLSRLLGIVAPTDLDGVDLLPSQITSD